MSDSMVIILAVRSSSFFMTSAMVGSAMAVGAADAGGGDVGFGWRWRARWFGKMRIDGVVIPGCQGRYATETRDLDSGARTRAPW
jgi:hypothetical protein